MNKLSVLIPLPPIDFDPSEVSVSWKILQQNGIDVFFATPNAERAYADPIMLTGEGLDPWGFIVGLKKIKLIGFFLRASREVRKTYLDLEQDHNYLNPIRYQDINPTEYDGLLLPGGHAKGMRLYLENSLLQQKVAKFFSSLNIHGKQKPIAAICHGVVLAARSISPATGKSVLYGLKTTALPWEFERTVWNLCKYFARWWDPHYYRTYLEQVNDPEGYASVEHEVKRQLKSPSDFLHPAKNSAFYFKKTSALFRDSASDSTPAWVVQDSHYISARWPGDVHTFAQQFADLLRQSNP